MKVASLPPNENERLAALDAYCILDTLPERDFDDLTLIASHICKAPIALISLVDKSRQWFKSKVGLDATETSRDVAFCAHAILQDQTFVVEDSSKDERFKDNPLATGAPHVKFYAGVPLKTPSGLNIGTLCVIDHTAKKLNPEQLNALEALARQVISQLELRKNISKVELITKTKTRFFANMSHEIRTSMNGIIGMTNLLLDSSINQDQNDKLKIIKNCGNSLLDLINDILDFSKLEEDKVEIEERPFGIHDAVLEVIELLGPRASEKNIKISYLKHDEIPDWVSGDVAHLRQILLNLVSNALKFTEYGSVEIKSEAESLKNDQIKIKFSVKDSGIGIPEDVKNKLFVAFSQVDASTTRRFGGTGLGLSICKGLCEKMGGTIWLENTKDLGSTFCFTFITKKSAKPVKKFTNEITNLFDSQIGKNHPLRILVAEDNQVNQLVIVGMLKKLGFNADVVESGNQVLESLKTKSYDLILMDCLMPGLDGYVTTQKIIEQYPEGIRPSVVALTASTSKEDVDQCFQSGMSSVLHKPIEISRLIQELLKCVPLDKIKKSA